MRPSALGALVLVAAVAGAAESLREPSTGVTFPADTTLDGVAMRCVGVGLRTRFMFKVYAAAFCLEASAAQKTLRDALARGGGTANDAFFEALAAAPVARGVDLAMVRDVSRATMAEAFADALRDATPQPPAADIDRFAALFDRDVHAGDHVAVVVHPDGHVALRLPDSAGGVVDSAAVGRVVLHAWIGPRSVTPALRTSIAEHAGAHAE
jgi:hypothetical protein